MTVGLDLFGWILAAPYLPSRLGMKVFVCLFRNGCWRSFLTNESIVDLLNRLFCQFDHWRAINLSARNASEGVLTNHVRTSRVCVHELSNNRKWGLVMPEVMPITDWYFCCISWSEIASLKLFFFCWRLWKVTSGKGQPANPPGRHLAHATQGGNNSCAHANRIIYGEGRVYGFI
jgi:hypothetical protein